MMKNFLKNCKAIYQAQGENALYYVNADAFLREGEECVSVVPLSDDSGVIGVALEHSFWNEEDEIFETYQEMFEFPEDKPELLDRKQKRAARRVQNARHKKSDRLHGKGVFSYEYKENGILKTQILPDNMRSKSAWSKACHEWGDPDGLKGRIPRTQSVNIHFTDGATLGTINMSETDVAQTWSVSSYNLCMSTEDFFQYMDNMDWKRIPSEVQFSVYWNAENPFTYPEPEYFEMSATLRKTQKTVSAEKAKEEYLKFKKEYQVFQKYGKKLRALREEMYTELRG